MSAAGPAAAYTVDMPIHSNEEVLDGTSNTLLLAEALSYTTRLELPGFSPIAISERGQRFDTATLVTPRSRYKLRDVLVSGYADGGTQVVIGFCKTDQASVQPHLNE